MGDRDILAKLDQMQEQLNSIQELLKLCAVQNLTAELEQGLPISEPRARPLAKGRQDMLSRLCVEYQNHRKPTSILN